MKKNCKSEGEGRYLEAMGSERDLYSTVGPTAWRHWFVRCAVDLCDEDERPKMRRQIFLSVQRALRKEAYREMSIRARDFDEDFICQEFDVYMLLGGSRQDIKVVKKDMLARFDIMDDESLKQQVCGVIFSSERGKVREIARKAVESMYGWRPRYKNVRIGGKMVKVPYWEKAPQPVINEDGGETMPEPSENAKEYDDWSTHVHGALMAVSSRMPKDAYILLYMICLGISPSNKTIQRILGVGQVQAYNKVNTARSQLVSYMRNNGLSSADVEFIRALECECEHRIDAKTIKEIGL